MKTSPRRLALMAGLAAVLGLLGGAAAWLLLRLIGIITNAALFHRWGATVPSFRNFHPGPWLFVAALGGAFLVSLLAKWSPAIRGHGIPEAMEAVLTKQSRIAPSTAAAKPLSAAIAIGTGGPFGAEGPIIVTGGALGSLIGQVLPMTPSERKILLASGAAAGMAATFGAPLAAVVLAIELLLFEFSNRALVPLIVAASVAGGMHAALFGNQPLFHVPQHHFNGLGQLWIFALVGVLCGLLAVVVVRGLFLFEGGFRRLPVSQFWHPMIGALGFATVGLLVPRALGVGYDAINDVLATRLALGALAILFAAKLLAWWVALASGTSGGTLAPVLLVSGSFGAFIGELLARAAPGLHVSPGAIALVAMAATFGAATRASFTAIVFAFELTHDYNAILPLMLAAVVADLVAAALLDQSLMTEKLWRRGLRVPSDYSPDVLQETRVGEVMSSDVKCLPPTATVGLARRRMQQGHGAYPIVDEDGCCVGIVTRGDLMEFAADDRLPVTTVASRDVVTVAADDALVRALELMLEEKVDHLPVVREGRLVGICTRTDILRARGHRLEHDRVQPGWRPRRREPRKPESPSSDGRPISPVRLP